MNPNTVLIASGLAGIALLALALLHHRRQRQRRARQTRGLLWLQQLRQLLALLQQHRGLSTGYLNGSHTLRPQIEQLQQQIRQRQRSCTELHPWLDANPRWQGLSEHWQRLSQRYVQLAVAANLNQHNLLIQNLLYLIDDMAQEHDLLLVTSQNQRPLRIAWQELLIAAECLGQARAVGTGVAARGGCDTLARIRLNYLWQKADHTTSTAWQQAAPSPSQRDKVRRLLNCLQQEITQPRTQLTVTEFFALATEAIDSLYQQYDQLLAQVQVQD